MVEYEDYDNTTDLGNVNEYEYEEEDERYGPAEREREVLFNARVTLQLLENHFYSVIHHYAMDIFVFSF